MKNMCSKGFVKRFVPFFLTFAVGLFVASFFVSIALPKFQFKKRQWREHQRYHQKIEFENQQLREENMRLKRELAEKKNAEFSNLDLNLNVPPPPVPLPPAPHAPFRR